ncbi:MAG: CRISPR-associated protein [Bacteroidota bacterium]|nr:CRISPR-associated protein [Bacteroidota bacterium]
MNLINLTNHPYSLWSEEQKECAEKGFGKVVDYPFPNVEPMKSEKDISFLADNIFEDVINKFGKSIAVHIMGEFTLCFALIKRFQKEGIICVASCTERNVTINNKGEKITRFEFKKFRQYE